MPLHLTVIPKAVLITKLMNKDTIAKKAIPNGTFFSFSVPIKNAGWVWHASENLTNVFKSADGPDVLHMS